MQKQQDGDDSLEIPAFLKRSESKATDQVSEVVMSDVDTAVEAGDPAPAVKAPRKRAAKANGASKPVKAAKAAPAKVKAASKAVKAKAKAKAKAPRQSNTPKDQFGFKVGSLKSQAAAMYASKKGATLEEVKAKTGSVQLNLLKALEGEGYKVSKVKEDGNGPRQVTRYFLRAK